MKVLVTRTSIALILVCSGIVSLQALPELPSIGQAVGWIKGYKEDSFYQTYPFDTQGTISVQNLLGPVKIKTWNQPKIVIKAVKKAHPKDLDDLIIKITIVGNHADIKVDFRDKKVSGSVQISLFVPRTASVTVNTSEDIKVKRLDAPFSAKTTIGSIRAYQMTEVVKAETQSGSIEVSYKKLPADGTIELKTQKAPIYLALPDQCNAQVEAETKTGTVTCEHYITLKPQRVRLNKDTFNLFKRTAYGTLGQGGPLLALKSTTGSIMLQELPS